MAAAAPFQPVRLHNCDGVPLTADTTGYLCDVLKAACSQSGAFACYETTNFALTCLRPLGVPLTARDGRQLSGRGFSFRVPRGPWVLWLVERLFGDHNGDLGAEPFLGNLTEGLWLAMPEPFALEVDYTQNFAYSAACNEPPRRPGARFPKLRYEACSPVMAPNGAMDVQATLQWLLDTYPPPPERAVVCAFCRATGKLKSCAACKKIKYCAPECQRADWPKHKPACTAPAAQPAAQPAAPRPAAPPGGSQSGWWDAHRRGEDGSMHFGKLELMTWRCNDENGEELGFGGFVASEEEETKREFEVKFGSDEARYFKHNAHGFRWTCCGVSADVGTYGCDHHGDPRAPGPCKCDFCRAGRPLSDREWRNKLASQAARGLEASLCRGRAGPASAAGEMNWAFRAMFRGED